MTLKELSSYEDRGLDRIIYQGKQYQMREIKYKMGIINIGDNEIYDKFWVGFEDIELDKQFYREERLKKILG